MRLRCKLSTVVLLGVLVTAMPSAARAPAGLMRSRSNAIRAAVKKNIDLVIRPKLVVARRSAGPVSALALSRDERYLVTAVGDNSLRLWDLAAGREVTPLTGHRHPVVDLDISTDNRLAVAVDTAGEIRLFDLTGAGGSQIIPLKSSQARFVAFADRNRLLIVGDASGRIDLWDIAGRTVLRQLNLDGGRLTAMAVVDSPPRVIGGTDRGTATLFRAADGKVQTRFDAQAKPITRLSPSPDAKALAAGTRDGTVMVWDLDSGKRLADKKVHSSAVGGLAINADTVVSGDRQGRVFLWRPSAASPPKPLGTHAAAVTFAQFDAAGDLVMTASEDGTTRLWQRESGRLLMTIVSTLDGWAVVDAAGRFDGNRKALSGIEWQEGSAKLPVDNFSEVYYRPALMATALNSPEALEPVDAIPEGIHLPPKVAFVADPETTQQGRSVEVRVRGEDNGNSGVTDLRLYRNGKRLGGQAEIDSQVESGQDGTVAINKTFRFELTPGENVLSAVAVNRERLESLPVKRVVVNKRPAATSRMWLVVVGINAYANTKMNLDYAKGDAEALQRFFSTSGHFPFDEVHVASITDRHATKAAIMAQFDSLRRLPPQDTVVVYMAGHGLSREGQWYFLASDATTVKDPRQLATAGVSSKELKDEIEAISANRIFLLIDACHSGGALAPIEEYGGMKALRMLARTSGVHILAATDRDQYAVELKNLGHGIFTYSVLQGLEGPADNSPADGLVSVLEVMQWVERSVPLLSRRYANYTQFPTAHSRGYDFGIAELGP